MKKTLFLTIMLVPLMLLAQHKYSVCNMPGVKADFSSLQQALDSAAAGSILYLFPSTINYGGGTVTKKVLIYGNGFLLDQNAAPATAVNKYGVNIQQLIIKQGGSNSYIEGVQFNNINFTQVPGLPPATPLEFDSAANVIISRCAFFPHGSGYFLTTKSTFNCIIRGCYFDLMESGEGNFSNFLNDFNSGSTGLQIHNNIITTRRAGSGFICSNVLATSDISFINNTIVAAFNFSDFENMRYVNNIFVDTNPSVVLSASIKMQGDAHNNIVNRSGLFNSTANYSNANPDSLFQYSLFGFHSEDQQWQLQQNSFANSYGTNGIACGAYGGINPYTLSGIPNLPNIYKITIQPDSRVRGNVQVNIKAKASN